MNDRYPTEHVYRVNSMIQFVSHVLALSSEKDCSQRAVFDDLLKLKYLHQRYTNYLKWLLWTR